MPENVGTNALISKELAVSSANTRSSRIPALKSIGNFFLLFVFHLPERKIKHSTLKFQYYFSLNDSGCGPAPSLRLGIHWLPGGRLWEYPTTRGATGSLTPASRIHDSETRWRPTSSPETFFEPV